MSTTTLATGQEKDRAGPRAARAHQRPGAQPSGKLGWMLAGPAFIVMLLVTAYPILHAVYVSLFNYRLTDPDEPVVRRPAATTGSSSPTACGGPASGVTRVHHRGHRRRRAGPRLRARDGHGQGAQVDPAGPADGDPHPLRDHHRRVGVRLAVRLRHRLRLRQQLVRLAARHRRGHRLVRRHVVVAVRRSAWPRSGRRRRSSRCCCSPGWPRCPRCCRRRRRSTAPPGGSGCARSRSRT